MPDERLPSSGCSPRAPSEGRADDTPEAIAQAARDLPRETEPLVELLPRARATSSGSTPTAPIDEVFAEIAGALEQAARRVIIRKSAARDRADGARRTGRRRDARAVGEHARAGRDDGRARRARRGVHPLAGRRPDLQGLPRLSRRRSARRRTRWSCTGSRARTRSPRATSSRSTSASRSTASSPTPRTRSRSARSRPRRSGCSTSCQAALAAGIEQARPGNRLSATSRHAVQRVTEEAGFSVVRSLVGHGVGRSMHEEPQIPNFGEPGRGPLLADGMTLAIEPMITAGGREVVLARRRLVDLDRRRLAGGPLRAHGRGHRRGPRILTRAAAVAT